MNMETTVADVMASLPPKSETPPSEDTINGSQSSQPLTPSSPPMTTFRPLEFEENAEWRARLFRLDESHHPKVEKMARWAEWFCKRFANNHRADGHWLFIAGPPGCGKTHVARRVFRFATDYAIDIRLSGKWHTAINPLILDWPDIAAAEKEQDFDSFCDMIRESAVVILDDVGAESDPYKSGRPADRLRRILSLCESKWLLATSNLTKPSLSALYDDRVSDRFNLARWCDMSGVTSFRHRVGRTSRNASARTEGQP